VALAALVEKLKALQFAVIDCQVPTEHLIRFGARKIPRSHYLEELQKALKAPTLKGRWALTS
jgi:leucyl/phenylalanyl-tRNA--protein transferase